MALESTRKKEKIEIVNLFKATQAAVVSCDKSKRKKLFFPKSFFLFLHGYLLAHDAENAGKYRNARHKLEVPGATFRLMDAWKIELAIVELIDFINNRNKWRQKFNKFILSKLNDKEGYSKESLKFIYKLFIAWYVHHQIVVIHPFVDGNGRLARLIMCLILRHEKLSYASFPPMINKIINKDKEKYLKTLSAGDRGDFVSGVTYLVDVLDEAYRESEREIKKQN